MINKTEKQFNDPTPESQEEKIHTKIEEEFSKYATRAYEKIREQFKELSKMGLGTTQKGEEIIAKRKKKYESLDINGKISELTNNFYLWWPDGHYRKLLDEKKSKKEADSQTIASDEKLVKDLDKIISEGGYNDVCDLIQKKNNEGEEKNKRMMAIADTFLKMLSMGHDGKKLRQ